MHSPAYPPSSRPRKSHTAFALVTVLAILALILVLVLTLSSVLHVETRSSASSKDLTHARQNALLGLEVAVGQLQEYAGKDQAVTFPATTFYPQKNVNDPQSAAPRQGRGPMFDDGTFGYRKFGTTSNARSYLTKVETYLTHKERKDWDDAVKAWWNEGRNPHWVGIMDTSLRVDAATNPNAVPAAIAAQRFESNPNTTFGEYKRDQLPVWLVSGNERFRINQETGQVRDNTGSVVATNTYPADYQTPLTVLPDPVDPGATSGSAEAKSVVWLVSDGSATAAAESTDGLDGRIKARKQPIEGNTAGGVTTMGHYAYWVGDESLKANFGIRDPFFNAATGSVDYRNRLQSPQRIGWENIEGFGNATFSINDAGLDNISTSKEITLLEQARTQEIFDASQENFHSLTAFSRSLLTDAALGGLKKDVSAFLISGEGLGNTDPMPDRTRYTPADPRFRAWNGSNTGFPGATGSGGLPTWKQVRDWYQNTSAGGGLDPTADIAPVLTYLSMHMGISYDPPTTGADGTLNWHWAPIIVLWNPYDAPLSMATYDLEVQVRPQTSGTYLAKINPSLAELQKDAGAEWDMRPVGPIDSGTGARESKLSFKGVEPNPDIAAAGPLSNYWPIVEPSNPKYPYSDATKGPDGYNIGGLGPFVYDDNFGDGTTDAFGRFYYMLRAKSHLTGRVRDPFTSGARSSAAKDNKFGALGAVNFNLRLNPHNNSTDSSNPLPVKAVLRFQVSASFGPGEARIFSFQGGGSPETVPAWDPVSQPPIALTAGVETFEPATIWFPVYDVINGPSSGDGLRFKAILGIDQKLPAVRLSVNGETIMEADEFGADPGEGNYFMGEDYFNDGSWGTNGGQSFDGDGEANRGEQQPAFVSTWRPIYSRSNFYDNFQNQTSNTASSLWSYGEHFLTPFVTDTVTSGSGILHDIHNNIAAFSRFNLGAKNFDLHPLVDRLRDRQNPNQNRNHLGNLDGSTGVLHTKSFNKLARTSWDNKQFSGDNGFALITHRDYDPLQRYRPLSEVPIRVARRPNSNVLSLGQFQQVNLSPYFWQPSFAIGNSWAGIYNDREAIAGIHSRQVGVGLGNAAVRPPGYIPNRMEGNLIANASTEVRIPDNLMLDMSYVLNENLWDRFFLSTIPNGHASNQPLPNGRMRFTQQAVASAQPSTLRNFDTSAAHLENFGALNVNTTSVEAWKALFTAFRDLKLADNPDGTAPISRTLDPVGDAVKLSFTRGTGSITPDIDGSHIGATASRKDYERITTGLRFLNDDMIQTLAERIVDEIRLRGPFLSMADFVNRRLVPPDGSRQAASSWFQARTNGWATGTWATGSTDSFGRSINLFTDFISPNYDPFIGLHGLAGALQRALDLSGINGGVNDPRLGWDGSLTLSTGSPLFDDSVFLPRIRNTGPAAMIEMQANNDTTNAQSFTAAGIGGAVNGPPANNDRLTTEPTKRSHLDTEHLAGAPAGEVGMVLQGAPGFATQGDLLAMVGSALTSRGDTFLIRTYGDSVDRNGRVLARAWLEAVVQRAVDPVSPAANSGTDQYRYTDKFGRKFKVINLRWLNPAEV